MGGDGTHTGTARRPGHLQPRYAKPPPAVKSPRPAQRAQRGPPPPRPEGRQGQSPRWGPKGGRGGGGGIGTGLAAGAEGLPYLPRRSPSCLADAAPGERVV